MAIRQDDANTTLTARRVRGNVTASQYIVYGSFSAGSATFDQVQFKLNTSGTAIAEGAYSGGPSFAMDRSNVSCTSTGYSYCLYAHNANGTQISDTVVTASVGNGGEGIDIGAPAVISSTLRNVNVNVTATGGTATVAGLVFNGENISVEGSQVTMFTTATGVPFYGVQAQNCPELFLRNSFVRVTAPPAGASPVGVFATATTTSCAADFDQSRLLIQGNTPTTVSANGTTTLTVGGSQLAGGIALQLGTSTVRCINSWNANAIALGGGCN
jgi:hypothetical protein